MQKAAFARDVIHDVSSGLRRSVALALKAGVAKSRLVVDPGIGFGKSHEQNCEIIRRLPDLAKLGFPLLIGTSRKSFLGAALKQIAEKGSNLGDGSDRGGEHFAGRAHRARARCGGDGAGGAGGGCGEVAKIDVGLTGAMSLTGSLGVRPSCFIAQFSALCFVPYPPVIV
jgi:hypothetical protein